jgi:hypothetical protein
MFAYYEIVAAKSAAAVAIPADLLDPRDARLPRRDV